MLIKNSTKSVIIIEGMRFYPESVSYVPNAFFEKYKDRLISSGIVPLFEMRETFTAVSVVSNEISTEPVQSNTETSNTEKFDNDVVEVKSEVTPTEENDTSTEKSSKKSRRKK